jgi:hypothetical protein
MSAAAVMSLLAWTWAAAPADELARARALVQQDLEYAAGIRLLERLTSDPGLARDQRVEAYQLLGVAYVAVGAQDAAEAAFSALLVLAPAHALDPLLSPKIHDVFARAKAKVVKPVHLLEVRAHPEALRLRVSARVEDAQARLREVHLWARTGTAPFERRPMTRAGAQVEGEVPLPPEGMVRVEYYLEGLDAGGEVLAAAGSAQAPSSVVVDRSATLAASPPPEAPEAWSGRWWLWAAVGAAVVGGAVAAGVLLSRGGGEAPAGTLDPIVLD